MKEEKSQSFRGSINPETRVLKILNRDSLNKFLSTLGGEVSITITEVRSRTKHQNDYLWGVVYRHMLANEIFGGYTKADLHETMKQHFKIASTSKLEVDEFTEFLDRLTRWCAVEHQIAIPDPQ